MALHSQQRITYLVELLWNTMDEGSSLSPIEVVRQLGQLLSLRRFDPDAWEKIAADEPKCVALIDRWMQEYGHRFSDRMVETSILSGWGSHYDREERMIKVVRTISMLYVLLDDPHNRLPGPAEGYIFETLLAKTNLSRSGDIFRTPMHIVHMMAALAAPEPHERVYDPACGTGGFLLGACRYVTAQWMRRKDPASLTTDIDGFPYAICNRMPIDLEPSGNERNQEMRALCACNLFLNGVDKYHISVDDSILMEPKESFCDVVLCNPPFGKRDKSYSVYSKYGFSVSELLYLEHIFDALQPKGRAVVIVPEGTLTNSGRQFVAARRMLVERHTLEAVISLPAGVFAPFTSGKSAILVLRNQPSDLPDVWFCALESDGYSLDRNRRRLKGTPMVDAVEQFVHRFKEPSDRTQCRFFVPLEEVRRNDWDLGYNRYREYVSDIQQVRAPQEILSEMVERERYILQGLEELRRTLI